MAALNSSGPISLAGTTVGQSIQVQLGGTGTTQISLNDATVRTLAGIASGAITMPTNFWGKGGSSTTQRGIFSYGSFNVGNVVNLVSNTGVLAADSPGAGSSRYGGAACSYGGDKGIFGYGQNSATSPGGYVAVSNLVSNTGVIAGDSAAVGTARGQLAACSYGGDKGMFAFGQPTLTTWTSVTNLISNTGVVSGDAASAGSARYDATGVGYGGDKGIFAYGGPGLTSTTTNLVSNTGVMASNTTSAGTVNSGRGACSYGTDKAIYAFGLTGGTTVTNISNLVSNTGVISGDVAGVGTARRWLGACGYGGDKGIFAYGGTPGARGTNSSTANNLVSNTGVVAANGTAVGSGRFYISACGYSYT